MDGSSGPVFTKIDPTRMSFLDLPQEVRDVVYKAYFEKNQKEVTLILTYPDTEFMFFSMDKSERRICNSDQLTRTNNVSPQAIDSSSSIGLMTADLLLVNKFLHKETLESLYENTIIGVSDNPKACTPSLQALPTTMLAKIKHLSLNINYLGYELSRLTVEKRTANMYGAHVTLADWNITIGKMPKLKTLEVTCFDVLELRNIPLRLSVNTTFLSTKTQVLFKMTAVGPQNARSEIVPISHERHIEGVVKNPKPCTVPAVQQLIFKARMAPIECAGLQTMDFNGHHFKKLSEEVVDLEWDEFENPHGFLEDDGKVY